MAAVVASAGTIANSTKNSVQSKLIHDGTRYWAFYMKSGTANTLFYAYSTNLVSWTEASVALRTGTVQNGGTITALYHGADQTVLVSNTNTTDGVTFYIRGVISGTTITWGSNATDICTNTKHASGDYTTNLFEDSAGKLVLLIGNNSGNPQSWLSTNNISATFADSDTLGNFTVSNEVAITDFPQHLGGASLASQAMLYVTDDSGPQLKWSKFTGTWSALSNPTAAFNGAGVSRLNWGIVRVSNTDIKLLGQITASTFGFVKFDGTSWSTLTAPEWPNGGLATNSQVSLTTDGTDVWALIIRGDASNTVSLNKYSTGAGTWGGWKDVERSTQVRTYISAGPVVSGIPSVMWTQVNGGNYDVVAAPAFQIIDPPTERSRSSAPIAITFEDDGHFSELDVRNWWKKAVAWVRRGGMMVPS